MRPAAGRADDAGANVNDNQQLPMLLDARPAIQGPLGRARLPNFRKLSRSAAARSIATAEAAQRTLAKCAAECAALPSPRTRPRPKRGKK